MQEDRQHRVTQLLMSAQKGTESAKSELFGLVYSELHSLAGNWMSKENPGNLLQTTALVNEAYIRLFGKQPIPANSRTHFFRLASSAMRRILIDLSRSENAGKRGGHAPQVSFEDWMFQKHDACVDGQLDLQKAIDALADIDPRGAEIVNLMLYSGRTTEEIASSLDVTKRTVERDLAAARLFLNRYLSNVAQS